MKTSGYISEKSGEIRMFIKLSLWLLAVTVASFAISAWLDYEQCQKQLQMPDNATAVNQIVNCSYENYFNIGYVWGIYTQANADLNEMAEMEDKTGADWLIAFLTSVAQGVVYVWVFVLLYMVLFSRILDRAFLAWVASVLVGLMVLVFVLKLDGLLNLALSFIP